MAKGKKSTPEEDNLQLVEGALSKSEQFIEDNSKILTTVLGVIIAVIAIYLAYSKFYVEPRQDAALSEMFFAEQYFETDSFNLALNGDGNNMGFLYIIDEYGSTKSGNLAQYYAGISYLNLGEFDLAIKHLKSFSAKDPMLSAMSNGAIGDAYSELGNNSEALSYYKKAASFKNDFATPMYLFKAAQLAELNGDHAAALKMYEEIEKDYSNSTEARNIKKYITRAKLNS